MSTNRAHSIGSLEFVLWSRVECVGPERFVARVSAIPKGHEQRCAPEERSIACVGREEAERAASRLARHLAHDIRCRGNRVTKQEARS